MRPDARFDRTVITVNTDETVNTLVEFTAPAAPDVERAPIDVAFVIDRSGSMGGEPIVAVRDAVAEVLRQMGPADRAAVVVFDHAAQVVLPLGQHHGPASQQRVRSIEVGGSTNLSAGWFLAEELLRRDRRDGAVRRIVVLTDGAVNQGVVAQDDLSTIVSGGQQAGVSTSCIGFSDGYQEELLGALANAGGGNDYWCEGSDAAARVFLTEFEGLAKVVAQNVAVTVTPTDAVAVVEVLNDFNVTALDGGAVRVDLGDAFGEELRSVLVRFRLRPQRTAGPVEVADLRLSWVSTVDGFAAHDVTVPITITAGENGTVDNGADPRVAEEVVLLETARDRREARRLADRGDFDAAEALQRATVDQLADSSHVAELRMARSELDQMESRRWDATSSKASYSASRLASRKRQSTFRTEESTDDSL